MLQSARTTWIGIILPSESPSVGFYVQASGAESCRVLLFEHGLGSGVVRAP